MDSDTILFLLKWAALIAAGGYGGYIVLMILLKTLQRLWHELKMFSLFVIYHSATAISNAVIDVMGLLLWWVWKGIKLLFRPIGWLFGKAKAQQNKEREWQALLETKNPAKEARDILGLPDQFTATDLKSRHRELMKRVAPDTGGTDWLAARVNAARDILKKDAS